MENFAEYLPSNNVLALLIASAIFIVTVALIAKKLVNFVLTLILLAFAIFSGMAIANNDLVREYLKKGSSNSNPTETTTTTTTQTPHSHGTTLDQFREEAVSLLQRIIQTIAPNEDKSTTTNVPAPATSTPEPKTLPAPEKKD